MRMKRGFVKNSSENAPCSERSAAFHAGAIKPEQGFCGSGFAFFQSVRWLLVPPDKGNEGSKRNWR